MRERATEAEAVQGLCFRRFRVSAPLGHGPHGETGSHGPGKDPQWTYFT